MGDSDWGTLKNKSKRSKLKAKRMHFTSWNFPKTKHFSDKNWQGIFFQEQGKKGYLFDETHPDYIHPEDMIQLVNQHREFRAQTLVQVPLDSKNVWMTKQALKYQGDLSSEAAATRRSKLEYWSTPIIGYKNDTLDTFKVKPFLFLLFSIFLFHPIFSKEIFRKQEKQRRGT